MFPFLGTVCGLLMTAYAMAVPYMGSVGRVSKHYHNTYVNSGLVFDVRRSVNMTRTIFKINQLPYGDDAWIESNYL